MNNEKPILLFTLVAAAALPLLSLAQTSAPGTRRVPGLSRTATTSSSSSTSSSKASTSGAVSSGESPRDYGVPEDPVFDGTNNPALKFENAPSDILIQTYAEVTGKTPLVAPDVQQATITLRSQSMLTREEYLQAIETVLAMHNISLMPDGEKFIRVYPSGEIRKRGIETHFDEPENGFDENGRTVSQMYTLKNISIDEAKTIMEGFKRNEGQVQVFERTNSLLITDTAENVNRMLEVLKFVDQPLVNREETSVRPIKFAKAADIKARLEEIITESQKEQEKEKDKTTASESRPNGPPGMIRRPGGPSIRFGTARDNTPEPQTTGNSITEAMVSDAERGVIRGKVQIVADERTNKLIFITRPENMEFFDRIIDVLDVEVETAPDIIVEVMRLEYANAKDVAEMLNNLIGNNTTKDDAEAKSRATDTDGDSKSSTLADAAEKVKRGADRGPKAAKETVQGKLGELKKENVTILSDERSNAVIVMASPADMISLRTIVKQMDIQLSQVVIETVIVSVTFRNSQETGMDWVQRTMVTRTGSGDGAPTLAFATAGGGGGGVPKDTMSLQTVDSLAGNGGGVNGWLTFFDLNMDVILKAIQGDSRARVMSSPRITTMDNKEATLEATQRIYWKEGTTYYSNSDNTSENIKNEDIGIKLSVTPRINKNGYITLTIKQDIQTNEGYTDVTGNGNKYPQLTSRSMGADVAVQSGETVVLGGLAENTSTKTTTKVPVLGSIPLLGWFFRHEMDENTRTEIIVFLTPRVIDTPAQMEDDARKIRSSIDTAGVWDSSWSNSRLADPIQPDDQKALLESANDTVAPPRHPLSGYLTGANEGVEYTNDLQEAYAPETNNVPSGVVVPYIHFSDVDSRIRKHNEALLKEQE